MRRRVRFKAARGREKVGSRSGILRQPEIFFTTPINLEWMNSHPECPASQGLQFRGSSTNSESLNTYRGERCMPSSWCLVVSILSPTIGDVRDWQHLQGLHQGLMWN
ncbi:hypothetical protein O3P69_002757 [Scylla paramamosain]|uniref:Uncharacterized protein n=1 Tax=Scylla paramamosain TaxID=85552 RepID=A0AAW0UNI9_SCYPA